jgi:hypothetical protein
VHAPGLAGSAGLPDLASLPAPVRLVVEQSFGDAIADLFLLGVPLAVVALVAVLALPEIPLHRRTGLEQRAEVRAEVAAVIADVAADEAAADEVDAAR